ncbi:MAG: peptidoglycan DD-metalloendopeptidase family protein [Anaerolineae bacterium]
MRLSPARVRIPLMWRYALAAITTIAGCCLVAVAQHGSSAPTPPVVSRQIALGSSARGGARAGSEPLLLSGALRAIGLGPITAVPTVEAKDVLATTVAIDTPVPPTPTPEPARVEIIYYKVQPGDNLRLIADKFGIDPDTLVWANPEVEKNPDLLRIDQELAVLPVDGVLHTVQTGDTLAVIAKRYSVSPETIINYPGNDVADPSSIKVGQKLIVPGGKKPAPVRAAVQTSGGSTAAKGPCLMIPVVAPEEQVGTDEPGRFVRPASGIITQGYWKWHGAVDIADKAGTPIVAADAGVVTFAGGSPSCGLGYAVQIDHGDGFVTNYAHLNSFLVQVGQQVQRGEVIGQMGSTGHSTGPHLHFVVLLNGTIVNPARFTPLK